MENKNTMSRRDAIGGIGALLTTVAIHPAMANTITEEPELYTTAPRDPTRALRLSALLQVSGGASQEKLKNFGGKTPLGRPGQPAELASIFVQLAAEDASFATGQIYGSSGGEGQP
jgi:NAD(P)-dependent dehydrogenase (short-subunit alcohol dehydrogenase family)